MSQTITRSPIVLEPAPDAGKVNDAGDLGILGVRASAS
jgi:hypothetical protein